MLRQATHVKGFRLGARDGEIGRIKDFYFEDERWTIRYLVADTNAWLPGRKVLLSPFALCGFREEDNVLDVNLTKDQIKASPGIDEHMPISRRYEAQYAQYYNWPYYWQGTALWGPGAYPVFPIVTDAAPTGGVQAAPITASNDPQLHGEDAHLRSTNEMHGYHLHASDGEIGHVDDFILDDQDWRMRYIVLDTRNWLPGKKVLLPPEWIRNIQWEGATLDTDLRLEAIRRAPEYIHTEPITREYEERLYQYYGREPYWETRLAA